MTGRRTTPTRLPDFRGPGAGATERTAKGALLWHDPQVDRAYYEEIAGELRGLVIRLDDRLTESDTTLIMEYIDANELGLALEQMADVLSEDEHPLSQDERADMLRLAKRMQMGDRVPSTLELCPER